MKCQKCKEKEATCLHYLFWEKKPLKVDHQLIYKGHPEWFVHFCQGCHDKEHRIEPKRGKLRRLVVELVRTQKARFAVENIARSLRNLDFKIPRHFEKVAAEFSKAEKGYEKEIKGLLESGDYPVWNWLKEVKGISYKLAGKLLAYIDIFETPKPSNLWQFCGFGDPNDKKRKGYKIRHNPDLKSFCWQIGDSFVKQRTLKYREVYDKTKEKELKRVKRGHADNRARRMAIKAFLLDLYLNWRKAEGLPVSEPYSVAIIHGVKGEPKSF